MQKREIQVMIKSSNTKQRRISLMENYTRALLGLTDKNFIPEEHWLEVRLFDKSLIVVLGRQ